MQRLQPEVFDWLTWRNCSDLWSILEIRCREDDLVSKSAFFRKHVIGYCPGDLLMCRPKKNTFAVMIAVDDTPMWFHMSNREFNIIFV